ncbi:YqiA/YcfP family alpha/beta fold hydrolase [Alteromonas flava]|uniref:YqiA/YcfP family alpha/beta fold hydrolase n=1 Tax=Alteromonas flava TaxID=2048003 RepID=UPI000C28ACCD|nr:YqiA/YcfP family alpha/beta fold hydrolase [Alteromonas flava]
MPTIVYLHGFLSSPQSQKAQETRQYIEQHHPAVTLLTPQIPNTIDQVPKLLLQLIRPLLASGESLRLIGSSMGGFLSNWLVEQFGGKAVLINPAVGPYRLMLDYLGEHVNPYTGEAFTVTQAHTEQLRQMEPPAISSPAAYKVLLQTGDETLDYRLAEQRYAGAELVIETGGDHSFVNYAAHLPAICEFLLADKTD